MKILYINACVRENSRTKKLADYLITKLGHDVKEIDLDKTNITPIHKNLLQKRFEFISQKNFDDEMFSYAKDFVSADTIVIAAPYWDFSFPSLLKVFFEHINISKLVFDYSDEGKLISLCKAKKLYYVTSKGGYGPDNFGFEYVRALCNTLYGINDVILIKAEGLDVHGNNTDKILEKTKEDIDKLF